MEPWQLTAAAAAAKLQDGSLTAEALTRSCLERCAEREPVTKAFAFLDADLAIRNARLVDKAYAKGVLHGLPLGVKDMIDTADMPTTHNSPLYAGLAAGARRGLRRRRARPRARWCSARPTRWNSPPPAGGR